eukprot:gene27983-33791_t
MMMEDQGANEFDCEHASKRAKVDEGGVSQNEQPVNVISPGKETQTEVFFEGGDLKDVPIESETLNVVTPGKEAQQDPKDAMEQTNFNKEAAPDEEVRQDSSAEVLLPEKGNEQQEKVSEKEPQAEDDMPEGEDEYEIDDEDGMHILGGVVKNLLDRFALGAVRYCNVVLKYQDLQAREHTLQLPIRPFQKVGNNFVLTPEMKTLLSASVPSPFGHGSQTVYNTQVRSARHIPADRILSVEGPSLQCIIEEITAALFPMETDVRLELLKLNIYQEGDFFTPHQDTPLSKNSLGSLVIALPCAHAGGKLIIRHRHEVEEYDFGKLMENKATRYSYSSKEEQDAGYYEATEFESSIFYQP